MLLTGASSNTLETAVSACRDHAARLGLVVTAAVQLETAHRLGFDFVVAKGHEAGGLVGEETTFVLLQQLLRSTKLPVYAWGGIGWHTAAACRVAGAAGIVIDWQLALTRESPLSPAMRRRVERMDGSETTAVRGPDGQWFRLYKQPGFTASEQLELVADTIRDQGPGGLEAWYQRISSLIAERGANERAWPSGQDAAFAASWNSNAPSVGRALRLLRGRITATYQASVEAHLLSEGSPMAQSHRTTYPVVQGPMTRVSDVPEFCDAVEQGGGLPFLALALMRGPEVRKLMEKTRELMGQRSWGVGILGFVPRELREEQLAVIEEIRPPFAIIAGGRPDQAAALEALGITVYLHVPSPGMLAMFIKEGARRFIFEGRECGGHVGPRSSFVLWESMIQVLLEADLPEAEAANAGFMFGNELRIAKCLL